MHNKCKLISAISLASLLAGAASHDVEARPKTDVIVLDNGDQVTGEIKKLQRGKLTLKTDFMGTVDIEWAHIAKLESKYFFQVELSSGARYFGSIKPAEQERRMTVTSAYSTYETEQMGVVNLTPIEKNFLDRIKFSIDAGYNYAQSNKSTEFTLHSTTSYRVEKYLLSGSYSSLLKQREDTESTRRNEVDTHFIRYLKKKWFLVGLSQFLQSDELSLDLRTVIGGGAGRSLISTNQMLFSVFGGAVLNREKFTDEDLRNSGEGLLGVRFQTFKFSNPELDITTSFNTIPSLSDRGRVRLDFDTQVRIEILRDLFVHVTLFNNYDSRPPEGAGKNDFGINTGVGWTF